MSPLSLISTLGMLLLGARGPSAGVLRELMQMDKFYTFNPHLVLKNVTAAMQDLKDVHDVTFFCQFLVDMVSRRVLNLAFVRRMRRRECAWKGGREWWRALSVRKMRRKECAWKGEREDDVVR